jgi:hypothetical protein
MFAPPLLKCDAVIFVAALVIAATVRLDAPPGLEGALAVRLLEEGHRVTKVEGDVALVVTSSGAGYAISAGDRRWQIEPGPPGVVDLEILQRAALVLDAVAATRSRPAIALELRGPGLSRVQLIERFLARGVSLTRTATAGDLVLCAEVLPLAAFVAVIEPGLSCPSEREEVDRRSGDEPWIDRAMTLIDRHSAPSAPLAPSPAPVFASRTEPAGLVFAADARGAFVARSGGADPSVMIGGGASMPNGIGAGTQLSVTFAGEPQIDVFEIAAMVGPTWTVSLSSRLALRTGLFGGALVHVFDAPGGESGTRIDPTLELPIVLLFRTGESFFLELFASGGLSGRERSHLSGVTELWRRGRWRAGLGLGVGIGGGNSALPRE